MRANDEIGSHGAHVLDGDAPHGRVGVHDETQHDLEKKVDGEGRDGMLRQKQIAAEEKERSHRANVHLLPALRVTWKRKRYVKQGGRETENAREKGNQGVVHFVIGVESNGRGQAAVAGKTIVDLRHSPSTVPLLAVRGG